MTTKIPIDSAGRLVLPKAIRDELRLNAGDNLLIETEGDRITLRPVRPQPTLKKEHGIWVYQGEPSQASIPELLEQQREKRVREFAE